MVKVLFGGCNYGAEVLLDGRKVAEHNAPMTPFAADLTGLATPGKTHRLQVKAYTRYHFGRPPVVTVGFDFNKGIRVQALRRPHEVRLRPNRLCAAGNLPAGVRGRRVREAVGRRKDPDL